MSDYLHLNVQPDDLRAMSSLALAHMGDAVYEILARGWLCTQGRATCGNLHKETVALVRAEAEAGVGGELFEVGAALRDGAEEVIDLPERDDDGDAGGEAHDDGHRNEADEAAELQKSRGEQQYAGGKAGEEDALQPVLRDDAEEHGAHRACGTGDLIGRTAENGDDDARGGGRAGADAERQRERQRHGADGQARHDVLEELVGVIAGKFGAKIAEKGRKHTHSPRAIPQHGAGAVCTKRRGSHCAVLP